MLIEEIRENITALIKFCVAHDIECIEGELKVEDSFYPFHFVCVRNDDEEEYYEKEKP